MWSKLITSITKVVNWKGLKSTISFAQPLVSFWVKKIKANKEKRQEKKEERKNNRKEKKESRKNKRKNG